jgi:16S rRNA G1207 methylase RsmC
MSSTTAAEKEHLNPKKRMRTMPHYYDAKQETPLQPKKIMVSTRGARVELWSGAGVFSKDHLDDGTKLLIDAAIIKPGCKVHDLGCGIGVVAVLVKMAEPSVSVVASDVSERAIELTKKNATLHKLDIDIRLSDGYAQVPEQFDAILFNPPYVAGRETIYRLMQEAHDHLLLGGTLQLVALHNKGGETLGKRVMELFGNCDDSRRFRGYRVYVGKKE